MFKIIFLLFIFHKISTFEFVAEFGEDSAEAVDGDDFKTLREMLLLEEEMEENESAEDEGNGDGEEEEGEEGEEEQSVGMTSHFESMQRDGEASAPIDTDEGTMEGEEEQQLAGPINESKCDKGWLSFRDSVCFYGLGVRKDFNAGVAECEHMNANFTSIHSVDEFKFITSHWNLRDFWVGVFYGKNHFEDGTPVDRKLLRHIAPLIPWATPDTLKGFICRKSPSKGEKLEGVKETKADETVGGNERVKEPETTRNITKKINLKQTNSTYERENKSAEVAKFFENGQEDNEPAEQALTNSNWIGETKGDQLKDQRKRPTTSETTLIEYSEKIAVKLDTSVGEAPNEPKNGNNEGESPSSSAGPLCAAPTHLLLPIVAIITAFFSLTVFMC